LQSIVRDATENISSAADEISHTLALSMARSAAIPHGQVLTNDEMESVVNQLFACSNVNFTPDGKAILCILPQKDIEQLLG
jgi:DNA mismatch repair protein MutL